MPPGLRSGVSQIGSAHITFHLITCLQGIARSGDRCMPQITAHLSRKRWSPPNPPTDELPPSMRPPLPTSLPSHLPHVFNNEFPALHFQACSELAEQGTSAFCIRVRVSWKRNHPCPCSSARTVLPEQNAHISPLSEQHGAKTRPSSIPLLHMKTIPRCMRSEQAFEHTLPPGRSQQHAQKPRGAGAHWLVTGPTRTHGTIE